MKSIRQTPVLLAFLLLAIATNAPAQSRQAMERDRNAMVDKEIVAAGVSNPRVVESMRTVPRHEFVSLQQRKYAYYDMALPIGESQTISPPYIVAFMTEQLDPQPGDKVLEIGTGSGYQAAVLSSLVRDVYTIEIVEPLGRHAAKVLKQLRYENVHVKVGDGFQGWPEHAPFDKIIVTCSPESIPPALAEQLKEGGRMLIPLGERYQQNLVMLRKTDGKLVTEGLKPVLFVPMTGKAEERRQKLPDPANPEVYNGDFEETVEGNETMPYGWYYQRQLELVTSNDAPSGKRYAVFKNAEPGRGTRALQGMAVDGRLIRQLKFTLHLRGEDIRPGQSSSDLPLLGVVFYDENRAIVGQGVIGPWRGTFPWEVRTGTVDVPARTREAIIRIGLFGATGMLSIDGIRLESVKGKGYEGRKPAEARVGK